MTPDDMANDPIYKTLIAAIEQAEAHNITPISVSVGPFGIPIIESHDVPTGTIMILEPKRDRYDLEITSQYDDENGRPIFVATLKPKWK
jgi:hypothetical protein